MPFEPLRTDEKLEKPVKREKDMDTLMLMGCSAFSIVSLVSYALAIWPHFMLTSSHLARTLLIAFALGLGPSALFGFLSTRKLGPVGACGFIGGAFAGSMFLYLRLKQVIELKYARDPIVTDYPDSWGWIVPLAWVLGAAAIAMVAIRREVPQD